MWRLLPALACLPLPACLQAYRLLAEEMYTRGWDYPLHLGVTEAGERAGAHGMGQGRAGRQLQGTAQRPAARRGRQLACPRSRSSGGAGKLGGIEGFKPEPFLWSPTWSPRQLQAR